MGHYDNCREGYCGRCGQAEDDKGNCLDKHCKPFTGKRAFLKPIADEIGLENLQASKSRLRGDTDKDALLRESYDALKTIGEHYVELAECGDCGFWNPEKEKEVIQYRATLAKIKTALGDV